MSLSTRVSTEDMVFSQAEIMKSNLITLVSILATPWEYRTYLVVLHTMEYMINPNTKVCGICIMYFAHRCFGTLILAKLFPCDIGKNHSLSFLVLNGFSILSICIFAQPYQLNLSPQIIMPNIKAIQPKHFIEKLFSNEVLIRVNKFISN